MCSCPIRESELSISPHGNILLSRLAANDIALLGPAEHVTLGMRDPLEPANQPTKHVYFMQSGLASVVTGGTGRGAVEVGIVGHEGMTGIGLVHGDTQSPFETFIQSPGSATRFDAATVQKAIETSDSLRACLLLYARTFQIQIAATAFANARFKLEERLARWLLMVADRTGSTFEITHEFISMMLGVRRSGVTLALQILEGNGLITANRGVIIVRDREGLVECAAGSYGLPEREYRRLLGAELRLATGQAALQ